MWWFRAEAWAPRGISPPSLSLLPGPIHSSLLKVLLFEGAPTVCLFILYVFSLFLHFRWEYRLLYKTEKCKRAAALSPFLLKVAPASSVLCFLPKFSVHVAPCIAAFLETLMEKTREFQKNIYFCFIDYAKAFDCVDHNKLRKILKEMGIPGHLTCLLRNLYAGQEATVRTGHGTTNWFQIGKGGCQGCILSPCLFNFYAEYIMRNTWLDKAQAGIKIARRNINADDTTLMAESEEEQKSLLMKVKEESEKVD